MAGSQVTFSVKGAPSRAKLYMTFDALGCGAFEFCGFSRPGGTKFFHANRRGHAKIRLSWPVRYARCQGGTSCMDDGVWMPSQPVRAAACYVPKFGVSKCTGTTIFMSTNPYP